jgi:putative flavoprotein involved in K+ transport
VVVATGYCDVPFVPPAARALPPDLVQVVPSRYRTPDTLPAGGVLVVGASSTGVQLADEIQASGRAVTLAVGRHTRLPRMYRGRDILWWLAAMGVLHEHVGAVADAEASRRQPSLQLAGREDRATLDLRTLEGRGVRLAGRLREAREGEVFFDDDLVASTAAADVKLAKLLARIERFAADQGLATPADPPEPFEPFLWPREAPRRLDLAREGIRSVVWATGFKRRYPWLRVPVLDQAGEIRHREGVTEAPGLYVLGLQFQRRRHSAFIGGVGDDALFLAEHIASRARGGRAAA